MSLNGGQSGRLSVSDNCRVQILCKVRKIGIPKELRRFLFGFLHSALTRLSEIVKAPLRLIAARSLEVYEYSRVRRTQPQLFAVHDVLECGHVHTSLLWEFLDLVNAYSDNPEISARRRRCHPCAKALAKKPVQSVKLAAKAGVA